MSERLLSKRRKRQQLKKRWRLIQSTFFIVILLATSFILLKSSLFNVKTITVEGQKSLKPKEIIKLSGIGVGENTFKVNLEEACKKIKFNPLVEDVSITRNYPSKIVITVSERKPIGIVPVEEGFVEVDKEGYLIAMTNNITRMNLPIITGINLNKKVLGTKIISRNLVSATTFLENMPAIMCREISEINVSNPHQVVIYTISSTQIRLGSPERLEEKIKMLETVLKSKPTFAIEYIDISYNGPPVFKPKSEDSQDEE